MVDYILKEDFKIFSLPSCSDMVDKWEWEESFIQCCLFSLSRYKLSTTSSIDLTIHPRPVSTHSFHEECNKKCLALTLRRRSGWRSSFGFPQTMTLYGN